MRSSIYTPARRPARKGGARVLCHGDVKGEHLYVSEDGGRLTAIIDWADMAISPIRPSTWRAS